MRLCVFCFVLLAIFSCNKKKLEKGIIIQEIFFENCMMPEFPNSEYIINSDTSLAQLLTTNSCSNLSIDFNNYTLLGLYITGKCNIK